MKDEEMAEEYAERTRVVDENTKVGNDCISLVQDYEGNYIDIHERIKQAFLAGLKAGRPQWHKVADGDLPNTAREVLIFMWGSYYLGYYKQYDGEDSSWHFEDFDEESEQVIAWCEIPTFDKE